MPSSLSTKGFSLLELTVALALGVLISAAGLQMFIISQQSAGFQRGMSDIQSSGRFALDFLRDDIRRAGGHTASDPTQAVIMLASDSPGAATQVSTNNGTSGINNNDQLVLRFFSAAAGTDCEGNAYAKDVYVTSRYFVRVDADTGLPALACDSSRDNKTAVINASTAGQVIIAGVDNFQVLYGVDDGVVPALPSPPGVAGAGLGVARVSRYVTATQYAALAPRPVILSVRIGLLLSSTDQLTAGTDRLVAAPDYQVLDNQILSANVPRDRRSRLLFVGTIELENFDSSGV